MANDKIDGFDVRDFVDMPQGGSVYAKHRCFELICPCGSEIIGCTDRAEWVEIHTAHLRDSPQ